MAARKKAEPFERPEAKAPDIFSHPAIDSGSNAFGSPLIIVALQADRAFETDALWFPQNDADIVGPFVERLNEPVHFPDLRRATVGGINRGNKKMRRGLLELHGNARIGCVE